MKTLLTATATILALAAPAMAEGDAEKGKKVFNKCKACHMVKSDDGEAIVKGGKTGPNLYGVIGRVAGSVEDFKYGAGLVDANEDGFVWSEDELVAYAEDPKGWLEAKGYTAKSKMTFKLKKDGADVAAFLAAAAAEGS
ncbi:c-type cytochrome [Roseovarius sp. 2305UL8-3]|uniref:c-type cytochrome n=1 Tax=Roseovarius conchicola TaxID=3121636 RepID=UPI003526FFD3